MVFSVRTLQPVNNIVFSMRSEIIFYAFLQSDWLHERSVWARTDRARFKVVEPMFLFKKNLKTSLKEEH